MLTHTAPCSPSLREQDAFILLPCTDWAGYCYLVQIQPVTVTLDRLSWLLLPWTDWAGYYFGQIELVMLPWTDWTGYCYLVQTELVTFTLYRLNWLLLPCTDWAGYCYLAQTELVTITLYRLSWLLLPCTDWSGYVTFYRLSWLLLPCTDWAGYCKCLQDKASSPSQCRWGSSSQLDSPHIQVACRQMPQAHSKTWHSDNECWQNWHDHSKQHTVLS